MRSYVGEAASSSLWGLGGQGRSSGKAVGRGSSGRGGSQPADFTPGKTISPRGLALGKGDNPQEGSVGRGLERQKRLAKVPQTSLWPKLFGCAWAWAWACKQHTHPSYFLSRSFVPRACTAPRQPSHFRTSAWDDLQQYIYLLSLPPPTLSCDSGTQGSGCFPSLGLSFPLGGRFWIWLSGPLRQSRAAHRERLPGGVFTKVLELGETIQQAKALLIQI